jgi:putative endonuclease
LIFLEITVYFSSYQSTGEMAERLNAAVLKTVIPRDRNRGFESPSLLHPPTRAALWRGLPADHAEKKCKRMAWCHAGVKRRRTVAAQMYNFNEFTNMEPFLYFVYSIQSLPNPHKFYIGLTTDINRRLEEHNAGKSVHTNKHTPWILMSYTAFTDKSKAQRFESYLKTGSGRTFAKKRL